MRIVHGLTGIKRAVCPQTCPSFLKTAQVFHPSHTTTQARWHATRKSLKPDVESAAEHEYSGSVPAAGFTVDSAPKPRRGRPRANKKDTSGVLGASQITPISQKHHDMPSFLAYAKATALSRTSNVYLGTHYEYLVSTSLTRLGFALTRVGGASDRGIDLLGHWSLPSLSSTLPAIIQCKATTPQAAYVRELEGAMQSAPAAWKGDSAVGMLAASKAATKGVRDAIARSSLPMAFLCISADEGMVRQFIWNQAAVAKCGLEGVGVGLKHPEQTVVLTWQGEPCKDL